MDIQPFHIHVPESDLSDLLDRLIQTRWPDEIEGAEWDYGSNLAYTKELVEYWISEFEWRPQEASLNSLSNFRAEVDDGLSIHFIHEKGVGLDPMPLIITHGWPSSIATRHSRSTGYSILLRRCSGPRPNITKAAWCA